MGPDEARTLWLEFLHLASKELLALQAEEEAAGGAPADPATAAAAQLAAAATGGAAGAVGAAGAAHSSPFAGPLRGAHAAELQAAYDTHPRRALPPGTDPNSPLGRIHTLVRVLLGLAWPARSGGGPAR